MRQRLPALLAVAFLGSAAHAQVDTYGQKLYHGGREEDETRKELDTALPRFPRTDDLSEVYVSAVTTNKFFIDRSTLVVAKDDIVRYALIVETGGGARNVTYEGMDCREGRWKIFGIGRSDGTWAESRNKDWRPIENKPVNRHHAAIYRDLFCPNGAAILSAEEGINALRLGKHPSIKAPFN